MMQNLPNPNDPLQGEWHGDQWDYLTLSPPTGAMSTESLIEMLGQVGNKGWELCHVLMADQLPLFVFKRKRSKIAIAVGQALGLADPGRN